jgi:hypothetical protein
MAKPRGRETVADMVRSLAVVGAVVAALFLVVVWQRPEVQGDIRPPVDVAAAVAAVQSTGPFPVLAPSPPDSWTATSAWFEPSSPDVSGGVLHVGYETASGSYAEVKQTDADRADAVAAYADRGVPAGGQVELSGLTWQRLESERSGRRALVASRPTDDGAVVLVVTGKADWPELEALAGSLR